MENMNKSKLLFFICIFLGSCAKKSIEGYYKTRYDYGGIELKKDSTYHLQNSMGYSTERSFGSWQVISRDSITLKSKYRSKEMVLRAQYSIVEPDGFVHIEVNPIINNTLRNGFLYEIVVNDSIYPKKQCYPTVFNVPLQKISSIRVRFISESVVQQKYDTLVSKIVLVNNNANRIKVEFDTNVELFNYFVIDETVKVHKGKMKIGKYIYRK